MIHQLESIMFLLEHQLLLNKLKVLKKLGGLKENTNKKESIDWLSKWQLYSDFILYGLYINVRLMGKIIYSKRMYEIIVFTGLTSLGNSANEPNLKFETKWYSFFISLQLFLILPFHFYGISLNFILICLHLPNIQLVE